MTSGRIWISASMKISAMSMETMAATKTKAICGPVCRKTAR